MQTGILMLEQNFRWAVIWNNTWVIIYFIKCIFLSAKSLILQSRYSLNFCFIHSNGLKYLKINYFQNVPNLNIFQNIKQLQKIKHAIIFQKCYLCSKIFKIIC